MEKLNEVITSDYRDKIMVDRKDGFSLRDLADILFRAQDSLNYYWNFYLVAVVAICGWILTRNVDSQTIPFKVAVSVVLIGISITIFRMLKGPYTLREAVKEELKARINKDTFKRPGLYDQVHFRKTDHYPTVVFWVHATVDLLLLAAIWFLRFKVQV